jgi:2-succinyl-5-enolpyruvyl-6-hydroxy-3-cyclohexene-1-carboxylate synthase
VERLSATQVEPLAPNQALALEVIERLRAAGIRTVCLCPGGRNAALVEALEPLRDGRLEVLDFFDERGAAFFALGRARRDDRAVAVVTTSGTAAAELLPAMVEAYYQGARLVAVTADRPRAFRGTGAPQSIEQANLFGVYARQAIDLEGAGTRWHIDPCCWPVHVNVPFDEPLLGDWREEAGADVAPGYGASMPSGDAPAQSAAASTREAVPVLRCPLVILGTLTEEDRQAAAAYCEGLGAVVLADVSSRLRDRLAGLVLNGGEPVALAALRRGLFDGVIRIGDTPAFRIWRDLERMRELPVVSVSRKPWRGLTHGVHLHAPPGTSLPLALLPAGAVQPVPGLAALRAEDGRFASAVDRLLRRFPRSEAALVREVSEAVPAGSFVYLGNSLPIREWNAFASRVDFDYGENRGANGIDGQLSTFLGWAGSDRESWALVGDLTTLYDLASLWALRFVAGPVRVVVVNNGGGRIFGRLFRNPRFENEHDVTFDLWARMWGVAYSNDPGLLPAREPVVVELRPDRAETRAFWRAFDELASSLAFPSNGGEGEGGTACRFG